jgi:thiol-disulfide isomerase/thioredoxin
MNRRLVIGAVGVAALGAGVATALLRGKPGRAAPAEDAPRDWAKEPFERPEGGKLALADFYGKPLLLNFWATWCPPCVKEMPLLDRFHTEQRSAGWQVLGIAVDKIDPVREFLAKHPVGYPIGVAGLDALEWLRALGNVGGGLPFSVALASSGSPAQKKIGEIDPTVLQSWVAAVR